MLFGVYRSVTRVTKGDEIPREISTSPAAVDDVVCVKRPALTATTASPFVAGEYLVAEYFVFLVWKLETFHVQETPRSTASTAPFPKPMSAASFLNVVPPALYRRRISSAIACVIVALELRLVF